jgi:hypothetical protein
MSAFVLRVAVIGGTLLGAVAVAQQPPLGRLSPADARKLKDEVEALLKEKDKLGKETAETSEVSKLRKELLEKLKQLPDRLPTKPPAEVMPPPKELPVKPVKAPDPVKADPFPEGLVPLDPLRVAQNYFKAGDVDAAYRALRMTKTDALSPDDRTFAQYLTGCCLRRLGKLPEAAAVFREIADGKQDEFMTESALSQLAEIRKLQEIESQLEQLRAKRKAK